MPVQLCSYHALLSLHYGMYRYSLRILVRNLRKVCSNRVKLHLPSCCLMLLKVAQILPDVYTSTVDTISLFQTLLQDC